MRSAEQDRRVHFATITETTLFDSKTGSARSLPTSINPPERLIEEKSQSGISFHHIRLPFAFGEDDYEAIEEKIETTYTGVKKAEPLSVIERLRVEHPGENIVRLGVGLKNPSDMGAFYFQYTEELKASALDVVRENPNDTARGHITRMAKHVDRKAVTRWSEFFATGTLSADTRLVWLSPANKPQEKHDPKRVSSWGDLLVQERELKAQTEAELDRIKLFNIRLEHEATKTAVEVAKRRDYIYEGAADAERDLIAKGLMSAPVKIERPVRQGIRITPRSAGYQD